MRLMVSDAFLRTLKLAHGTNDIFVSVPENMRPPYSVIGKITEDPVGGKNSGAAWFTVEIIDWTQAGSRAPLDARMKLTKDALRDVRIDFAGLAPFKPQLLPGGEDDLFEDGVTWSGTQRFKILGQPG